MLSYFLNLYKNINIFLPYLDESYTTETRDQKKQRAISKAVRQAELKRLRIAQEIQREQEEIEVQLKELETRGVLIEKALRGEEQPLEKYI